MEYLILRDADQTVFDLYEKALRAFWFRWEISADLERNDRIFLKTGGVKPEHLQMIRSVLTYFLYFDGLLNDCIKSGIDSAYENRVIQTWFNLQKTVEDIHNITYVELARVYIDGDLGKAIDKYPAIRKKIEFVKRRLDPASSLATQLIVQTIIETLFFQSEFAVIFFICDIYKSGLQGLLKANEMISRDEGGHADMDILLFNRLPERPSQEYVWSIFREAMDIKTEYIRDYIPNPIPGFNAELSIQYSQFITDSVLTRMGYEVMFGVANPFPHMMRQSAGIRMTDFFISTPTDYSKASEKSLRFGFEMKPMDV